MLLVTYWCILVWLWFELLEDDTIKSVERQQVRRRTGWWVAEAESRGGKRSKRKEGLYCQDEAEEIW